MRNGDKGCVMPEPVPVSGLVLLACVSAISAMRTQSAVGPGNCGLTTALATACTIAQSGPATLLLLCGGDKTTQAADIRQAQTYWTEYQERRQHEPPDQKLP